jgi:hypothetical protein
MKARSSASQHSFLFGVLCLLGENPVQFCLETIALHWKRRQRDYIGIRRISDGVCEQCIGIKRTCWAKVGYWHGLDLFIHYLPPSPRRGSRRHRGRGQRRVVSGGFSCWCGTDNQEREKPPMLLLEGAKGRRTYEWYSEGHLAQREPNPTSPANKMFRELVEQFASPQVGRSLAAHRCIARPAVQSGPGWATSC